MRKWFGGKASKSEDQGGVSPQSRPSSSSDADLESGDLVHAQQEELDAKSKAKKSVLSSTWRKLRRKSPKDKTSPSSPAKETPKDKARDAQSANNAGKRSKTYPEVTERCCCTRR
eukprot:763478-Hanusia_phi.AAC.6